MIDYTIVSHREEYDNPLEYDLENLKYRLLIQEQMVEKTRKEIAFIEDLIANQKKKNKLNIHMKS